MTKYIFRFVVEHRIQYFFHFRQYAITISGGIIRLCSLLQFMHSQFVVLGIFEVIHCQVNNTNAAAKQIKNTIIYELFLFIQFL